MEQSRLPEVKAHDIQQLARAVESESDLVESTHLSQFEITRKKHQWLLSSLTVVWAVWEEAKCSLYVNAHVRRR